MRAAAFITAGVVGLASGTIALSLSAGAARPVLAAKGPPPSPAVASPGPATASPPRTETGSLVLVLGGDVNLGRDVGQGLLRDAAYQPLAGVRELLSGADLAFVNLESVLSDHTTETQSPTEPLTFKGTSAGARALTSAGVDVVSVANNHLWDYARVGFDQTLLHLGQAGVHVAGARPLGTAGPVPVLLARNGVSVAVFAVTAVWNAGDLRTHPAASLVDRADLETLLPAIARAREEGYRVVVSYHGGTEYEERPTIEVLGFARAAIRAGADAFIGHHPHVPQGMGWVRGRPAFYSLGNLVFGAHRDHPATKQGYLARLTLDRTGPVRVEACPYRIDSGEPRTLGRGSRGAAAQRLEFARLSGAAGSRGVWLGESRPDGCFDVNQAR